MPEPNRTTRITVAVLAGALVLTGRQPAVIAGFLLALIWVVAFDRKILRKVGRPKFWAFSIVVTLLAGMLLGSEPQYFHGIPISQDGLFAGLLMNLRAFSLIVTGVLLARSISRERFLGVSGKFGAAHLDAAFREALETLPQVNKEWQEVRKNGGSIIDTLARLLANMADLAERTPLTNAFAVTGVRSSGKTTLLLELGKRLEQAGWKVGGIRQERVEEEGVAVSYRVVRWNGDQGRIVARGESGRGFSFDHEAFAEAAKWILEDAEKCDLLIVDELGLLEAQGGGHAPALHAVMTGEHIPRLAVSLRKDKREELSAQFGFSRKRIIDMDSRSADKESFIQLILASGRPEVKPVV